jgi:hypothetical protein
MKRILQIKPPLRLLTALLCAPFLFALASSRAQENHLPLTWQQSSSSCVRLAIRDKFGTLGKYAATFLVHAPDGKQHACSRQVTEDGWGQVFFPDDFPAWWDYPSGHYVWTGQVAGKTVVHGGFSYSKQRSVELDD